MTSKLYDVILADPPWSFQVWEKESGSGRNAEAHYPTMDLDDICSLDVRSISAPNCALFLWCTWPKMLDSKRCVSHPTAVFNAWGFDFVTKAFTWVKFNKNSMGIFTGMGFYTRSNDEVCLLGVRGNMPVQAHDVHSIIMSPVREHSRKPDEQYEKIQRLYPAMNYLEMFARRRRPGWDAFGNQVEGSIELK